MHVLVSALVAVLFIAEQAHGTEKDAEAALKAWAEAYDARDGEKSAAVYAQDARLWGTVSQKQTVGRDAKLREPFRKADAAAHPALPLHQEGGIERRDGDAAHYCEHNIHHRDAIPDQADSREHCRSLRSFISSPRRAR